MTTLAIVGAAESDMGEVGPGLTPADLMRQATLRALDDAGLALSDVDGLFAATSQLPQSHLSLGEALGILPQVRWLDGTHLGGASALVHLEHAQAAIAAGLCEVAVIAYASTQRSAGRSTARSGVEIPSWEAPYTPMLPIALYAMAAARHMAQYGTTAEDLARVAVSGRRWAMDNPKAWSRDPLTVEDVLAAPRLCDPFGVRDCCLVTDAGGALVVTSAERARTLRREPVHLLGAASMASHRSVSGLQGHITVTGATQTGPAALQEAGLRHGDVDAVQLYDAFTITPLLYLEDIGFCAKGEAGAFVASGATLPGGSLPMNTNGGGLSYQHPGMYGMQLLNEAVRRLRETDDHVVLGHGMNGPLASHATVVLGDASTR